MKYRDYIYATKKTIIKISAKRKPSPETMPRSGTWVVKELYEGAWWLPCCPEIVWETLSKFNYLGELKKGEYKR